MPPESLGTAVIVVALLLGAWCLLAAYRDRAVGRYELVGLGVVQALVLAEIVTGVVHLANGQRPHELVTFVGYLMAIFLILPLGALLARLEPTRWGSVIAGVAGLVVAVLVLRINQIWTGIG
jgi:hypothetical protein